MIFYNKNIAKRCFPYKKKYFYNNITGIPKYIKSMHFLIKNGYDEYACWETFDWFIKTMRSILQEYKANHECYPILIDDYPASINKTNEEKERIKENEQLWDNTIDKMIKLLDDMDEDIVINDSVYADMSVAEQVFERMRQAKDEFFELFSKYFYHLWD